MTEQDRALEERHAVTSVGIGAYEPPRITTLGTIAEITRGRSSTAKSDGTFPGSIFR